MTNYSSISRSISREKSSQQLLKLEENVELSLFTNQICNIEEIRIRIGKEAYYRAKNLASQQPQI